MDSYLKLLKEILSDGTSQVGISVTSDEATQIAKKISYFAFFKSLQLHNINAYLLFQILYTPFWRKQFLWEVERYAYIFQQFAEYLDFELKYPTPAASFPIPSKIYYFAQKIPEISDSDLNEAIIEYIKTLNKNNNYDLNDQYIAAVLNKFR